MSFAVRIDETQGGSCIRNMRHLQTYVTLIQIVKIVIATQRISSNRFILENRVFVRFVENVLNLELLPRQHKRKNQKDRFIKIMGSPLRNISVDD